MKTGALMSVALIVQSLFLTVTGNVQIYFWIPCMILAVLLMIGFIFGCCDISLTDAAYFGMIAFVVAEFTASVEWQVVCYFWNGTTPIILIQTTMMILIYGGVAAILYKMLHAHLPKDGKMEVSLKEYISNCSVCSQQYEFPDRKHTFFRSIFF